MNDQLLDNQRKEYLQLKINKKIDDTLKSINQDESTRRYLGTLLGGLLGAGISSGVNALIKHDGSLESFTPSAVPIMLSALFGNQASARYNKIKRNKAIERLSNQLAELTQA